MLTPEKQCACATERALPWVKSRLVDISSMTMEKETGEAIRRLLDEIDLMIKNSRQSVDTYSTK